MRNRQLERWAPVLLAAAVIILWQVVVQGFAVPEYLFPSPWEILKQMAEFKGPCSPRRGAPSGSPWWASAWRSSSACCSVS